MSNYKLRISIKITADYECTETMVSPLVVRQALRRITKNALHDAMVRGLLRAEPDTYDCEFSLLDSNVEVNVDRIG